MIPRIYINAPLEVNGTAHVSREQAHYLKNVLRRKEGDEVRLINGRDGEFAGTIETLSKKGGVVSLSMKTAAQKNEPPISLHFAPVKRGPLETIVQKATELGVEYFQPVITARTVAPKLNIDRLQAISIEASEQSGRYTIAQVRPSQKLDRMLNDWPEDRRLIFCDEAGDDETKEWGGPNGRAQPMLDALKNVDSAAYKWAVFIGPEGGFAPEERALLRSKEYVTPVTLGPRILRADTAAIAALTLLQAARGDWREG